MRAAGIQSIGGAVETIDLPDLRPLAEGEVLIEVKASGVGNWDEFTRKGQWDVGIGPPMALGVEASGVVAEAGRGAGDIRSGDDVLTHPLPLRAQGTWAPWLIAPASLLARKPAGMSWEAAAAFPVPVLTATQVLEEALAVQPGETLLVNGGSGVTGSLLVTLGAILGARVITTAGPDSADRVAGLGADEVLDYHDAGWVEQARNAGVDAAANAVPGGAAAALRTVRDGGRLATITSDPPDDQRSIQISSVYVRPDGPQLRRAVDLYDDGRLSIEVGRVFPIATAAAALQAAMRGGGGKAIVLRP